jgi:hypothetical protein
MEKASSRPVDDKATKVVSAGVRGPGGATLGFVKAVLTVSGAFG